MRSTMLRGMLERERLEWMVWMFLDDIQSRREWCERGWISEASRDQDIAELKRRMIVPLRVIGRN
jgi:hypothetical protein